MKKFFPVAIFSVLIALIDLGLYSLFENFFGSFREYHLAVSFFVTSVIYVFMAVKTGSSGIILVGTLLRAAAFLSVRPYPTTLLCCIAAGAVLGELIYFFVKRKRRFLPNMIVYMVFYLCYFMKDYVVYAQGVMFEYRSISLLSLAALLGSFILSFVVYRAALMPKLRKAGIEK